MKRNRIRKLLIVLGTLIIIAGAGFVIWAENGYGPSERALAVLNQPSDVEIDRSRWIHYRPISAKPTTGVIFYPGGRVEPEAYSPLLAEIARAGYLVVNVPMPLDLAVFGINRAEDVRAAFPETEHWVMAGHSLGGVMAASYAYDNRATIDGLILYGSLPAGPDLAGTDLPVLSVFGSEERSAEQIEASSNLLPEDAQFLRLEGGNHAQFGDYGPQAGDGEASIDLETQQTLALEATLAFLSAIDR